MPLDFDDLVALHGKVREPLAFPLRIRGARVASTEFEHLHTAEKLNVKAELQSHLGSTVLGLVKGGWLPSGLILDEDTLITVANVLPELERGDLVRLLPNWYADAGAISLYYASRMLMPAKARVSIDFIVDTFESQPLDLRFAGSLG